MKLDGFEFEVRGARVCWVLPRELHVDADCKDVPANPDAVAPSIKDATFYAAGQLRAADSGAYIGQISVMRVEPGAAAEEPWVDQAWAEKTAATMESGLRASVLPPVVVTFHRPTVEINGETRFVSLTIDSDGLATPLQRNFGERQWMLWVPGRTKLWQVSLGGPKETSSALAAVAHETMHTFALVPEQRPWSPDGDFSALLPKLAMYGVPAVALGVVLVRHFSKRRLTRRSGPP